MFIIIIWEIERQKSVIFLSYSGSFFSILYSPSVSITKIWSKPGIVDLTTVPYTPFVHLQSLTEKSHPNKKLSKVDFPPF